jgi:hypothetical protein
MEKGLKILKIPPCFQFGETHRDRGRGGIQEERERKVVVRALFKC